MSRYFVNHPRSEGWCGDEIYEGGHCPELVVDEHVATDTGLLDAFGNTIWRAPNPVGFGRDEEW